MVGKPIERIDRHKDGSIAAKGHTVIDALKGLGVVQKRRHKDAVRIF
jgi:hypothetical protein